MNQDDPPLPSPTPKTMGFHMPAEWEKQESIILSYPLNPETWVDCRESMERAYANFVAAISQYERVIINCSDDAQNQAMDSFADAGADCLQISFLPFETNDAWCRDHGPVFLKNPTLSSKAILDFDYNSWGGKFPPWDLDDAVPWRIAEELDILHFHIPYIIEGGALELNGAGTLLTTESVMLNPNRNPNFTKSKAEHVLMESLGVDQVLWLNSGLVGDDTDGHIDTLTRFFRKDAVLSSLDSHADSPNYHTLKKNFDDLQHMRLHDGSKIEVVPLPCPDPIYPENWREEVLPASYANFLIINHAVLVPTYRQDRNDNAAVSVIAQAFPDRDIVPLDCYDIVLEGGALHCLTQQVPF